jgi:hypothetical protein
MARYRGYSHFSNGSLREIETDAYSIVDAISRLELSFGRGNVHSVSEISESKGSSSGSSLNVLGGSLTIVATIVATIVEICGTRRRIQALEAKLEAMESPQSPRPTRERPNLRIVELEPETKTLVEPVIEPVVLSKPMQVIAVLIGLVPAAVVIFILSRILH